MLLWRVVPACLAPMLVERANARGLHKQTGLLARSTVPARRTLHVRFNDLEDPESIPVDTDYASVIESDVPIVVQHTRLDSRQAENALLSTIAYASND